MSNPSGQGEAGKTAPSPFGAFNTGGSSVFGQSQSAPNTATGFGSFGGDANKSLFGGGLGGPKSAGMTSNTPASPFSFPPKSDENAQPASSPFGNMTTPNKPSLFGSAPQSQTSNLFGGTTANTSQTPSGAATPTSTQPSSLFGNVSTTPAGPPPPTMSFGQPAKSSTSLFGAPSTATNANQDAQSTSTTNAFGSKLQSPTASQPSTTSLFGSNASAPASGASLFGGQNNSSAATSLFGKPQAANNSGTDASGSTTSPTKPNPFGGFSLGNNQVSSATTPSTTTQADSSIPDQASTPKPFGFPATFAAPASKPAESAGSTAPAPSLFGAPSPAATSSSSSNPFGAAQSSTTTPAPSLFAGIGQKTNAASSTAAAPSLFAGVGQKSDAATPTNAAPSLFAGVGQKKDNPAASAPSTSLFAGLGQKRNATDTGENPKDSANTTSTTAPAASTTAAPSLFGNATKPAESSTAAPSLFGNTTKPAESSAAAPSLFASSTKPADTTSTAQAAGTTTQNGNAATLNQSTAGPAPPPQSRLKNKSMDEIITRWASDLSKYQKEFQSQAEKVATWDRMLLENGNSISKLYSKTFQAERDIAEVEKQLTAVEGHQDELSQWLDRYEREVDEMTARQIGQGDGLQGPDQERERTYKTAERVSERIKDMGRDLTSMIDEINDASASISKTSKADDPISQIVRVLNGHLSQLQLIDQTTSALQAKVTAAQKESKRLGGRGQNLSSSDAVDDFYRSYMSRA